MGGKNTKDENIYEIHANYRNKQENLGKLLNKTKKSGDELINSENDYQQRKVRSKQGGYGNGTNNSDLNDPRGGSKGGKNYYITRSDKPLSPSSRLQIDINDPLLIATLPPPLTSVFNENNDIQMLNTQNHHHKYQFDQTATPATAAAAAAQPTPAAQVNIRNNTFNVARSHINHELLNIDRNYTDPWRLAAHKMAQNNNPLAAKPSNKPTKSLLLQELLECPICMNRYDNPHVLPCQHTFCKSCIVTLKTNNKDGDTNKINCPICRVTHVFNNGLDNLPANYTMKRLIELEAMAAEKEAAELLSHNKIKQRKPTKAVSNVKKLAQKSNSSLSSNQSNSKYNPRYQKNPQEHHSSDIDSSSRSYLKLILLCHSSAIEIQNEFNSDYYNSSDEHNYDQIDNNTNSDDSNPYSRRKRSNKNKSENIYEDEYGKCKTFSKIGVRFDDTIEKIKKIVEQKFHIPYEEQLLVYKDKILKSDTKQLKAYHVRNYGRIHVFDKRDVKENLDDIDPYSIDQDFVKELAKSCLNEKENKKHASNKKQQQQQQYNFEALHDSSNNFDEKFINKNKKTTSGRYQQHQRKDEYHDRNEDQYDSYYRHDKVDYKQLKYSSPIVSDLKKHSIGYRRVRKLDELLDNPLLVYSK